MDVDIGRKAVLLLNSLGYTVLIPMHSESGRAALSKGMLNYAKKCAEKNTKIFRSLITEATPLLGIEPSALLGFKDEYIDLVDPTLKEDAINIAKHTFLFEEFISREIDAGKINSDSFTNVKKTVLVHGHCHQKALSTMRHILKTLSLPQGFSVEEIPSGCCGMAGSFGYEKDHYEISNQIGELILLPAVRLASKETLIAASGTSCRHQIKDATQRTAFHTAEILFDALK
jgi:Fe-S oxidoreductase